MSVEQGIYNSKNNYYDVLYHSECTWCDGTHTIWPWVTHLAEVLADSYGAFEWRIAAEQRSQREKTKQERVRVHILEFASALFTIDFLRKSLPGISNQVIRCVLATVCSTPTTTGATPSGPG